MYLPMIKEVKISAILKEEMRMMLLFSSQNENWLCKNQLYNFIKFHKKSIFIQIKIHYTVEERETLVEKSSLRQHHLKNSSPKQSKREKTERLRSIILISIMIILVQITYFWRPLIIQIPTRDKSYAIEFQNHVPKIKD